MIDYEVDRYEVVLVNGEKHCFDQEEQAVEFAKSNLNRHPIFIKIMKGVL